VSRISERRILLGNGYRMGLQLTARVAAPDRPRRARRVAPLESPDRLPDAPARTLNLRPSLEDLLEEHPVTIEINGRPVATLLCTPVGIAELAVGWAFAQGYFDDVEALRRVTAYDERVSLMIERPAAAGGAWEDLLAARLDPRGVPGLQPLGTDLQEEDGESGEASGNAFQLERDRFFAAIDRISARIVARSGGDGCHHAALVDGERLCAIARDLGRQQAVDKVIGWALRERIDRGRAMLCLDGRIDAEIVFKAWRAGIPILATTSAPTSDAVALAYAAGIAVAGHILDDRCAIYCHPWRVPDGGDSPAENQD